MYIILNDISFQKLATFLAQFLQKFEILEFARKYSSNYHIFDSYKIFRI